MSETDLKRKVVLSIKKLYPEAFVVKISDRWVSGLPDLLIICRGAHIFIELKVYPNKPTKIQFYTIDMIHRAGGHAYVCYDVDEVIKCLTELIPGVS